ncbi:MAG: VWA domain-containing protein [Thermoflexales bacterium]|nr:VWA domain-containing protein [Thermoflexales bacterium]MDW8351986.1 VWA domain-containing protein [Anaerolineae bacterium]
MKGNRILFGLIVGAAIIFVVAVLVGRAISEFIVGTSPTVRKPDNAIEVLFIYAPEFDKNLNVSTIITDFNRIYARGRNPLTGQPLQPGERPIWIEGRSGSSGTVHEGIINAFIAPNNANVERPVLWSPSVRHWLALVNYQTGRRVFDVEGAPASAIAPVVIAIWESRLKALQAKHGPEIGWEELLAVFDNPQGWNAYGLSGRQAVYYGHTDPRISSTALSTLIAEFYASARYNARLTDAITRLTADQVNDPRVQAGVRRIENLIKHYSARTTEFIEYIAQGPDYLDFVALEENDLIFINQGKTQITPPEKLVALYPKEGTFVHDHPFAIPNAPWVTDEQRRAAEVFTQYFLSKEVQQKVLEAGFRPANKDVPLGYPISPENGVDPNQPRTLLPVPDPAVIALVQQSWQLVKKQADVMLLIDTSGSMRDDNKIGQAIEAARIFVEDQAGKNNVGLMRFSSDIEVLVPLGALETNREQILAAINQIEARGNTALYDAVIAAVEKLQATSDPERIQAIVLLSDGQDTASQASLNEVVRKVSEARNSRTPILVIPVAYGRDADVNALNAIGRASDTKVQSGDPENIKKLLEVIGSYF